MLMVDVVNPGRVKDPRELEAAVERWGEKVKVLKREFDEKAIFTSMCPPNIQDYTYQNVDDEVTFDSTSQKSKGSRKQSHRYVGMGAQCRWKSG